MRWSIGGTIRWNDSIDATHVVVGQHHALRRAGRAAREDELEDVVGGGALPATPGVPPSRAGRRGRRRPARRTSASTVVVGKSLQAGLARVRRVAPGAEDQVAGARLRRTIVSIASGRHPQVERHEDQPGVHRAEVGGGQLGRRWRTTSGSGRRARGRARAAATRRSARAGRARGSSRSSVEPSSRRSAERRPLAVARDRAVEQVEQGRHVAGMLPAGSQPASIARRRSRWRSVSARMPTS